MDDEHPKQTTKKLKIGKSFHSDSVKRLKKASKRKKRRKRAKAKYYTFLQNKRFSKSTEDLCDSVKLFDVMDMDWIPSHDSTTLTLPPEVSEWQNQEQIAYWKSRAISLEIENRMLHRHIRDVYSKQIEDYHSMGRWTPTDNKKTHKDGDSVGHDLSASAEKVLKKIVPKPPDGKNRAEEMSKIFGESSQKIMGMETAIQLNYERHIENSKLPYWPNLPLNLKMDN